MENNVPEDIIKAIIAAGGNSRAARSARARKQLRDRLGRFIEMGGGLNFKFRMPKATRDAKGRWNGFDGRLLQASGRSVGGSDSSEDGVQVYISNDPNGLPDGFYTVPASSTDVAQALLTPEQLKRAGIDAEFEGDSTDSSVIDFNEAMFSEAPEGWTKNEDGSFTTIEDNITITPNEDGTFSLSQNGEDKGSFNNIGDAIVESNDLDAEAELPEVDKKKVAELRDVGDEEAAKKVIRNEPIATLPKDVPTPAGKKFKNPMNRNGLLLPEPAVDKELMEYLEKINPNSPAPRGEQLGTPTRTEGLINEDIADMSPEQLQSERSAVQAKLNDALSLPKDDQDLDLIDGLMERMTDIKIRENELAGATPGSKENIDGWLEGLTEQVEAPDSETLDYLAQRRAEEEARAEKSNAPFGQDLTVEDLNTLPDNSIIRTNSLPGDTIGNPNDSFIKKDGQWVNMSSSEGETSTPEDLVNSDRGVRRNQPLEDFWNDPNRGPVYEAGTLVRAGNTSGDTRKFRVIGPDANNPGRARFARTDERRLDRFDRLTDNYSSVVPDAFDPNGEFVVVDPAGDIDKQIKDAILKNKMVAFMYGGKPRLLVPLSTENRYRSDDKNLKAVGEDGVEKSFSYSRIEPLDGAAAMVEEVSGPDEAPETPQEIFDRHEAIPASDFQVGDDSNSSFLKEAPIGSEVSHQQDITDSEGTREATIKFTKTGEDQWTASGDDTIDGEVWSSEELSMERDTYTIDKIGEEGQIAELPSPAATVVPAPGDEVTDASIESAPNGTVLEGLETVVVSNDGTSTETVPARAYKKDGEWHLYADETDSPVFGQIGFPKNVDEVVDTQRVLDATAFGEPNSAGQAPVEIVALSESVERNYGGDTNDIPTLQRRLDRAQARLDRMGSDIMGRYSDDDMAEVDREIESLAARIEALNNGEDLPVDAPTELPEIRTVAAESKNPEAYDTDITDLEAAETASEQTKIATDIAVKADKNGDNDVAATAATVVTATKVQEEAETANTDPQYKKKLSAFAAKLLEKLQGTIEKEQARQRKALARKDVKTADSAQRRIDALNRTLEFMNLKTSEVDDYDPRGTREYVIANTTLDESSIERDEDGNLMYAEGIYVAPTGVAYRMVYDMNDVNKENESVPSSQRGTRAYLINDLVDPSTGRVIASAGDLAGFLFVHLDENNPESDASPVISARDGIPELDGGTKYLIPGYINAKGADPARGTSSPFKVIGSGLHGWTAAMATLDGRQYQHSSWLYPNGRAASHRFHTTQAKFHSRSQREKFFDLLNAPTAKMMRKLGYYANKKPHGLTTAHFNKDPDGKLRSTANALVWWGDFDHHVDTNIAKFALAMYKEHRDNPDAVPGVDYPKFLQEYIKGGDHTKIEQLSMADVLHTLNYEGGDRAAVATKLRNVMEELQTWVEGNQGLTYFSANDVADVSNNWTSTGYIRGNLQPALDVLGDVVGYLENPSNKLDKPLPAATESDTTLAVAPNKAPASSIEALPELDSPEGTSKPSRIFDQSMVNADVVKSLVSAFTEQELKDALEASIRRGVYSAVLDTPSESGRTAYDLADIAAALNERGIDDYQFVADIYDSEAGNTANKDTLAAYYERNKSMLPDTPVTPIESKYILAPLMKNESYDGLEYAMDPEAYSPVGTEVEGTTDDPKILAETFSVQTLRDNFKSALYRGEGQIRLQFPGASEGEEGPAVNVPVEAVRDALQLRGINTNVIAKSRSEIVAAENDRNAQEPEETAAPVDTSNVPATPASVGATPTPDTSVTVDSNDGMADTTANPATGATTASDVDLDDNDGIDAYDPEVIMQVIRERYPNAVEMSNGDLIVASRETTDADGNRIEFQTVVVRTRQEFFYTYIRRINHAETDLAKKYQSLRYGRMSQSARALDNTIKEARKRVNRVSDQHGPNTMNRWWHEPGQRGRVQQENVNPDTNEPEHVREQPIDRETVQRIVAATSDEAVSEAMVLGIFRHITQHGASQTVLNRLRAQFGMTRESMNTIVDAVNEHVAKQDRIRRFDTWVSADGETPLFEGDTVRHADGRVGVVVRRIIEHRTHDYGYSDYLYIRFPGRRSDTNMTSRNLTLVQTSGGTDGSERRGPGAIALPDPTLTVRAQNRMRREGRINDFAPEQLETDRFSGPLPTVTIDGTAYPVRGSRQTVVGDNMDTVSGDLSTAQVGDFTTTLDPETGALRVREIVGIEQNPDGTTTIFTFTPNDFGSGTAEGTAYTPDENGNFGRSVPLYRERPTEDTGLASQRDRETLGTAVSEADPASVPDDLKTRVDEMMEPNSTATSREVTDTAIEVSQLPKQPAGATDSVPLDSTRDILTDVKAEAPGDSTINLDTIDTASTLEGTTPEEKMDNAPAWFKDPMTPEAIDEKMGPATPATPVEMPPVTTPFEELPEEAPVDERTQRQLQAKLNADMRSSGEMMQGTGRNGWSSSFRFQEPGQAVLDYAPMSTMRPTPEYWERRAADIKEKTEKMRDHLESLGYVVEADTTSGRIQVKSIPQTAPRTSRTSAPETPAAAPEMPPVTTPFEELPEEPTAPQIPEGESSSPVRTPDVIQKEISDTEEKLVRARSAREAMGEDPILSEAIDSRIADLESQLNDLNVELDQQTAQGPELNPDELPFGEEASSAPQPGDSVDGEFINGSPVGTEITTVVNGQKVTYTKNADGTWVTTDTVTIEDADITFTPNPLSDEQMAARADSGNAQLGGEGPSDGGNGGGGSGPKAPTPDNSGGGGQASSTPASQPVALDSSEITAANEAVAAYNANRPNSQYTEDELKALPVGSFVMLVADNKYVRYVKTGPDTWERNDVNPDIDRGSSVIASKADSARVAARMRTSTVVGSGYTVRPIDNTDGAPATSTTVANALPGFIIHNNTTGEEFTKQEDGTWVSSNNGLPVSDFKMISTVGENVHSFSGNFFVGPNTATTPVSASTAEIAQYAEGVMDSPEFPGWRKATYEEVYDRALADNTARWTEATGREPNFFEKMALEMTVEKQLKGFDFYINGTVEIGIGKKFDKNADYVKQFMESVEELRVNNPLDKVRVMLSDKPNRRTKNLSGSAMYSQIGATGTTVITINGAPILNGRNTLSWNGKNDDNYFAPAYGTVPDIKYALIHEWGHAIDFASGATMRDQLWTLIEADPALKAKLSTYAASQPAEAFAELFTQLYLQKHHGATPIELAELIKKVLG